MSTAPPESEAVGPQVARDCMELLARPDYMVCSDITPAGGCPHPRCYGTFPRLLGRYRRELRDSPARRHGAPDDRPPGAAVRPHAARPHRAGYFADIVVFDAARVNDTATYDEPRRFPVGIPYVIVNGEVAVDQER